MTALPDLKWLSKVAQLCDKHKTRISLPDGTVIEPAHIDQPDPSDDSYEEEGATIHDITEAIRGSSGD